MDGVRVRPFTREDVAAAAEVGAAAFDEAGDPEVLRRGAQRSVHLLDTDPHGSFVAERDGRIIGGAQSLRREGLWVLAHLTVDPQRQTRGVGRALLDAALAYAQPGDAGLIMCSSDPRALRLYGQAGFALWPAFVAAGTVDRRALPPADPAIREAGAGDLDALAAISRAVRGAAHTVDLEWIIDELHVMRHGDRGFAVSGIGGAAVWMLVARDDEVAAALLWALLERAGSADQDVMRWITGEQQWAVDVCLRAGLRLSPWGALGVRGIAAPMRPFIPSGPYG